MSHRYDAQAPVAFPEWRYFRFRAASREGRPMRGRAALIQAKPPRTRNRQICGATGPTRNQSLDPCRGRSLVLIWGPPFVIAASNSFSASLTTPFALSILAFVWRWFRWLLSIILALGQKALEAESVGAESVGGRKSGGRKLGGRKRWGQKA